MAYEDFTDEQKQAGWDHYHGLSTHKWLLYKCADCDPSLGDDPEDEDDLSHGQTEPYRIICIAGEDRPDYCPRCQSYLGLCDQIEVFPSIRPPESWGQNAQRTHKTEEGSP